MYKTVLVTLIFFVPLITYYAVQYRKIVTLRNRLKFRITVNGTRGKSSVTRLITAGLRAGGFNVLGKTTGTKAVWLMPDGSEKEIIRFTKPNIKEMAYGLSLAAKYDADVYVAECMAVNPEYQKAIERYWMRSDITVMTNIRPDHEDILGKGILNVAKGLSAGFPLNGALVASSCSLETFSRVCKLPEKLILADVSTLEKEWTDKFDFIIPENLILALEVCKSIGVPYEIAVTGMINASVDAGNPEFYNSEKFIFIGVFAANDPVSTRMIADMYKPLDTFIKGVWLHGRDDRRQRTESLCKTIVELNPDFFIASGDIDFIKKEWKKNCNKDCKFYYIDNEHSLETIINEIDVRFGKKAWLLGTGNTHGIVPQKIDGVVLCRKLS